MKISRTISSDPIDILTAFTFIQSHKAGGQVLFSGTIRDHHEGKAVLHLEYHIYDDMANAELDLIINEAASKWPLESIFVQHRTGSCQIGDVAIVVAVSSVHRSEAFDGARFLIDEIKHRLPIWKKETTTEGTYWVEGCNHVQSGRH